MSQIAKNPAMTEFPMGGPHRIRTYNLLIKSLDMSRPSLSTVVQNAYDYGEIVTAPSTAVHRRVAALG